MRIQTILVPTDFSELSNEAVDFAFSTAKQLEAKAIILYVFEWPGPEEDLTSTYDARYVRKMDWAKSSLNDLIQRATDQGLAAKSELVEGASFAPPFVEIIKMARKKKADLIVMGTHGRTGLSHIMMGSQAEQVVRQSSCPVLTVKSAKHRFTPVLEMETRGKQKNKK